MMNDDEIISQRLLLRTSVLPKDHLKKAADNVLHILHRRKSGNKSKSDIKKNMSLLHTLKWELETFAFEVERCEIMSCSLEKESLKYDKMHKDIDESIAAIENEILDLKNTVITEQKILSYKEQYEELSREVNMIPSRDELTKKIKEVEKEIVDVENEMTDLNRDIVIRAEHYKELMESIQKLKKLFNYDNIGDDKKMIMDDTPSDISSRNDLDKMDDS